MIFINNFIKRCESYGAPEWPFEMIQEKSIERHKKLYTWARKGNVTLPEGGSV